MICKKCGSEKVEKVMEVEGSTDVIVKCLDCEEIFTYSPAVLTKDSKGKARRGLKVPISSMDDIYKRLGKMDFDSGSKMTKDDLLSMLDEMTQSSIELMAQYEKVREALESLTEEELIEFLKEQSFGMGDSGGGVGVTGLLDGIPMTPEGKADLEEFQRQLEELREQMKAQLDDDDDDQEPEKGQHNSGGAGSNLVKGDLTEIPKGEFEDVMPEDDEDDPGGLNISDEDADELIDLFLL